MVTTKTLFSDVDSAFVKAGRDGVMDTWAKDKFFEFKESICPTNMETGMPEDALDLIGNIITIFDRYPNVREMEETDVTMVCEYWDKLKDHEYLKKWH